MAASAQTMPSVSTDYFRDQSLFLTGGTGFLGLALTLRTLTTTQCRHLCLLVRGGEEYVPLESRSRKDNLVICI